MKKNLRIVLRLPKVRFPTFLKKYSWSSAIQFFLLLTVGSVSVQAAGPLLSKEGRISILTCGPGNVLYEAFGHSAVRVTDPARNLDLVFNYGVFDFNQENFYGNFAKGSMRYMLGMEPWENFRDQYRHYGRSIREQVLNLDSADKEAIVAYLSINLQPENREYYYDYFYNNCSTKILELLDSALAHRVEWRHSELDGRASFRTLIHDYTTYHDWGRLGIDLGLGSVIDRPVRGQDLNFLPDELEKSLSRATLRKGVLSFPLVLKSEVLYEAPVYHAASPFFLSPAFIFSLLLCLSLVLWYRRMSFPVPFRVLRSVVFALAGLLGVVQLSIWLFTNHNAAAWNFNLFWSNPLFFALALGWLAIPDRLRFLHSGLRFYLLAVLVLWFLIPQRLNVQLLPLVGALSILSWPAADSSKPKSGNLPLS